MPGIAGTCLDLHSLLIRTALTIALVDEYRSEKVIERERIKAATAVGRPIRDKRGQRRVARSNESINKTLVVLANILDTAVEHVGMRTQTPRSRSTLRSRSVFPARTCTPRSTSC